MDKKRILIPGGKTSDWPLIEAAHKLGMYVITSGRDSKAFAHKYADEYVCVDYSNKEAMLQMAKEKKIDYMCSSSNDIALTTTAYVCEQMGLPGHDGFETTLTLHHKDKFKALSRKLKLHVPDGEYFTDEESAVEYAKTIDYKVMVKPVDLVSGNGCSQAITEEEKIAAIKVAFNASLNKRIVIERFIEGTSHSFSTYFMGQRVVGYYCDDEFANASPFHITTSASPASSFTDKVERILIEDTEKVIRELNLVDGRIHTQYILDAEGEPHILEMSRRTSGDLYAEPESRALGIWTPDIVVRAECGMPFLFPNGLRQKGYTGRHCLVAPKNGKIKSFHIDPELDKHVYKKLIWFEDGYEMTNYLLDCVGILFYEFDSKEEQMDIVKRIMKLITFEYYI